jgi:hypothetical protein
MEDQEDAPNPGMPESGPEMPPPQVQPKKRCSTCSGLATNRRAAVNLKKVSEFHWSCP